MMSCWKKQSSDRPSFSDVVTTISNYTEAIAGYLDINFNPFESTHNPPDSEAATNGKKKSKSPKGSPKVSPKVSPKGSPKTSPRPSSRASPHISPRASPLLKVRDDQLSTTSSVGIEIRIENPSEDAGSMVNSLQSV